MAYEVLARKWRPKTFEEVVGQGPTTQTLSNAISSNRVAHAYLFVGPRGVGKTSIARIMAKALNCEKGPTPTPCDRCSSCQEITKGSNLDVLEIDGASNNQVDHVRELRENVRYAPVRGPFKIYIIDEVHMLSTAAFNALLKTLEEPPAHVKFIFATTEPQKVPATILSRCQRFDLRRISTKDIVEHLRKISQAEGIDIDDDALLAIARGAEGGMRDAESALDQLIAFRGKKIVEPDVLAVFGLASKKTLEDLAQSILTGAIEPMLKTISELDAAGKDLQRMTMELLEFFRNLLVVKYAGNVLNEQELTDAQLATLKTFASQSDAERILRVVNHLIELQTQIRFTLSKRVLLEVTLIRCARAATVVSIDEILKEINKLKSGVQSAEPEKYQIPPRAQAAPVVHESKPTSIEPSPDELGSLTTNWHGFVEKVSGYVALAKSYLLDAKPISVSQDKVILGFEPEFASNVEKLNIPRTMKAIHKVLEDSLRRPVTVEFKVINNIAPTSAPTSPTKPATEQKSPVSSKSKQQWQSDPIVKRALETFNGDIIDIHE